MLIPLKAIGELRRLTDEAKGDKETPTIRITQSGPNVHFEIAGMQFSVKLVDAQFPPYEQVIPKTSDTTVTAPRLALMDAVRSVSLAANDRTGGIKLTFTKSAIRITSESPESGAGFDEVPIDGPAKETTVGFNAKYLLDVLSAIDDTEVVIGCKGELDPITIRPSSELKGHRYSTVVMPMRI
jgi:DNA polymerase-3 subunit beta